MSAPKPVTLGKPGRAEHVDESRRAVRTPGVVRLPVYTGARTGRPYAADLTPEQAIELAEELLSAARLVTRLARETATREAGAR